MYQVKILVEILRKLSFFFLLYLRKSSSLSARVKLFFFSHITFKNKIVISLNIDEYKVLPDVKMPFFKLILVMK